MQLHGRAYTVISLKLQTRYGALCDTAQWTACRASEERQSCRTALLATTLGLPVQPGFEVNNLKGRRWLQWRHCEDPEQAQACTFAYAQRLLLTACGL